MVGHSRECPVHEVPNREKRETNERLDLDQSRNAPLSVWIHHLLDAIQLWVVLPRGAGRR